MPPARTNAGVDRGGNPMATVSSALPSCPPPTGRAQVEASWRGTGLCLRGDRLVGAQSGEERERTEVGARRKLQMNNVLHICLQLQSAECPGPKSLHPTPISAPF